MRRLIEAGLMFGNLIHVSSPVLIERYNRALRHLTGQATELTDFHVDISGFSPEVGEELDDPNYLNQNGCNRQFILLTTRQKTAPLLNAKFSTSRRILREFINVNENQLFALTAKDAVAGELDNSVFEVEDPKRLFNIHKIVIEADTTQETLKDADRLAKLVNTFKNDDDAWFDDVLISDMIALAKRTGDVVRNPVRLSHMSFENANFHTDHFGGVYLFRDVQHPAAICSGEKLSGLPIAYTLHTSEPNRLAKFLQLNGLVEPIVKARGIDGASILRQKMDFIVVDAAQQAGIDLTGATRRDIRRLARKYAQSLPSEWHSLNSLVQWSEGNGPWPKIGSDDPAYFYTLRSSDHSEKELVNMLLSEMTPKDVRQLFICHKTLFYKLYAGWSDTKKSYVVDFLVREYQADKVGARTALFGHDATMEEPDDREAEMIARVGPWGKVRR